MIAKKAIFSIDNYRFSGKAHDRAAIDIYPKIFPEPFEIVKIERTDKEDLVQGIDYRVYVGTGPATICFTIQERFRRAATAAKYRQVSITTWDHHANRIGELYKIEADYLIYGYYDDDEDTLHESVVVNLPRFKRGIATGTMKPDDVRVHRMQKREFALWNFDPLIESGVCEYHYVPSQSPQETE